MSILPENKAPEKPIKVTWVCLGCAYKGNLRHWESCGRCGAGKPHGA